MKRNKKAQIYNAIGSILPLVLGVGVAVLVLIFVSSLAGNVWESVESDIDEIGTKTQGNDTITLNATGGVADQLLHSDITSGTLVITNTSNTIANGNFTIDYGAGTVLLLTSTYSSCVVNASYDYENYSIRTPIREATVSSFNALEQTGAYLPLIILAVVIGIVMIVILGTSFSVGMGGNKGNAL